MTLMMVFPFAVAVLDLGAALVYCYYHQFALALIWFCHAIASATLGTITNR